MIYLPSLLQKIAKFATSAISSYNLLARAQNIQGYTMPDEDDEKPVNSKQNPALYNQIMRLAEQLPPPNEDTDEYDFKLGCYTVAELYRKALEINGGYNYLRDEVLRVQNAANEDDPQEEELVSLMDQIFIETKPFLQKNKNDLAKQDNPKDVAILKEIKQRYSTLDLAEQFGQAEFDKSGLGVNKDTGGGGGYQITGPGILKNWADAYAGELSRLDEKLKDIENTRISNSGFLTKYEKRAEKNIIDLKEKLYELIKWSKTVADFQNGPNPESESSQKGIEEAKGHIDNLRKEANKLRIALKTSNAFLEAEKIKKDIHSSVSDRSKFILKQELELQELLMESGIRTSKVEEKNLRKEFINALKYKNKISDPEYIKMMLDKIEKAKSARHSVREEKHKEFGTWTYNRKNKDDLDAALKVFLVAKNSVMGSLKDKIKDRLAAEKVKEIQSNTEQFPMFDSYLKEIENSLNDKDLLTAAKEKAKKAIKKYASEYASKYANLDTPEIKEYKLNAQEMEMFGKKIKKAYDDQINGKKIPASTIQELCNDARKWISWTNEIKPYSQIINPLLEIIKQLEKEL